MPRISDRKWAEAQEWYEKEGASLNAVAKRLGVAVSTVRAHRDRDEWGPKGIRADSVAETVQAGFAPEQVHRLSEDEAMRLEVERLRSELAEETAKREEAEAQFEKVRPDFPFKVYRSEAEVREFFGDKLWDIAARNQNRERKQDGFAPIEFEQHDPRLKPAVDALVKELLSRTSKFAGQRNLRVVKMYRPWDGHLVEVGVEPQMSNEAGQPGTAIWKHRDKGMKLVSPYLCQLADCWAEASVDSAGRLLLDGYCSTAHRARDPFLKGRAVEGVSRAQTQPGFVGIPEIVR